MPKMGDRAGEIEIRLSVPSETWLKFKELGGDEVKVFSELVEKAHDERSKAAKAKTVESE